MQIRYLISIFCAATLFRSAEGIGPPPNQISKSSDIYRSQENASHRNVRKYIHTTLHNTFTLRWRYKNTSMEIIDKQLLKIKNLLEVKIYKWKWQEF